MADTTGLTLIWRNAEGTMMSDPTNCHVCDGPIKVVYVVSVFEYPYNPEWPIDQHLLVTMCSVQCLKHFVEAL